jgi:hypothetical protein
MRWHGMTAFVAAAVMGLAVAAGPARAAAQGDTVLKAADVQKLLPDGVWYKGQSAPAQKRNSGGVKTADGYFVLATLVDNSGYASDVAAKYQAYFVTEIPIKIGGQSLAAGVYGVGFITDNKFVVTDIGAHDVFTVSSSTDDEMKRPVPLQVTTDPGGGFRLYAGRRYVTFTK